MWTISEQCSSDERGSSETQLQLQNLAFLHNIKNKQYLFSLLVTYLCTADFVQPSPLPTLVNKKNETLKISLDEATTKKKPIL